MCGFVGQFSRRGGVEGLDALVAATDSLSHRGPDDGRWWSEGPFFLGHRRLAVIDPAAGVQPMASSDGRYVIVFNGEIYNFIELREELIVAGHRFHTRSDTEVVLAGHREWGAALPARLTGMFAFAIADRRSGTLVLARDRFGEKPLFVHDDGSTVSFASTLPVLRQITGASRTLDEEALGQYLLTNYIGGSRTLINGISRLPPATYCHLSRSSREDDLYWRLPTDPPVRYGSVEDAADELDVLLQRVVPQSMRSDVPVALLLSGGIDSSLLAALGRDSGIDRAFCLDFADARFSEFAQAGRVASAAGIELERVELGPRALDDFPDIVHHSDPLGDSSALAVWTLARHVAARGYKVAIGGDGADELFGGYLSHQASLLHGAVVTRLPQALRHALAQLARFIPVSSGKVTTGYKLRRFFQAAPLPTAQAHIAWTGAWPPAEAARLLAPATGHRQIETTLAKLAESHGISFPPSLRDLQAFDVREYLASDILVKTDRMTMAHGLECRSPYLAPAIAHFALTLPDHFKTGPLGLGKRVPRALANRRFGRAIAGARKQGFSIPVHAWLRTARGREILDDVLSTRRLAEVPQLNADTVMEARARHLAGEPLGFELWGLAVLVAWVTAPRDAPAARVASRPMTFPEIGAP